MKKVIRLTESELISLVKRVINESDPKIGTGKKPKGSDRRLYTDENPSDTVSVKFKTKQDVIDTLNKKSFKSKSHARQSQIINLIHQRLRVALERAKDPEVKKRLRTAFEYIDTKKEASKRKTKGMKEGLHDTSWENDEGDKITLMDLLNATEDIPVEKISVEELKSHLLTWDGDEDEVKKIESADLQYPILIFVDNDGEFISIIDGHHRAQKAVRRGLETIKAKVIPINDLPKNIRKVFSHMGRQEESEVTEKWSEKYKKSINCNNPKGFSQRAHCQGRRKQSKMNDVEYLTWKEFKNDSNLYDGSVTKAYFQFKDKRDEKKWGVSDINQFQVNGGSYFCTTDNCIEHYRGNPGYVDEEDFVIADSAVIAVSEDEFIMDDAIMKKEIMSKADGFYCSPYDTYGLVIWNKNIIK